MKKLLITLAALALILSAGTVSTLAAGPGLTASQASRIPSPCFVDADGDGVCDNRESGSGYGFADGSGACHRTAGGHNAHRNHGRSC